MSVCQDGSEECSDDMGACSVTPVPALQHSAESRSGLLFLHASACIM